MLAPERICAQRASLLDVLHADVLTGRTEGNATFRELSGNVRIRQENVYISCDRALQNIGDNSVELIGHVVITQDTLVLKTERGMYYGNDRIAASSSKLLLDDGHVTLDAESGRYNAGTHTARFFSRVTVTDSLARIQSRSLVYDRDSARAVSSGPTIIEFRRQNATILADSVIHYQRTGISYFPVRPRLWQIDTAYVRSDSLAGEADSMRLDTLSIVAEHMESHRDTSNRFLASGHVEMVRGALSARCGDALYTRNDSTIVLREFPVVWQEDTQVTGDSIHVALADNSVRRVSVHGSAFSASRSKPSEKDSLYPPGRFDQTKGKNILIDFADDEVQTIRIEQTAVSLYYLFDGRALNGVRRESGDVIVVSFAGGKAEQIRTIGGVEGVYYPEKFVTGKESSYDLEGFLWRDDRPVQPLFPAVHAGANP